MIVKQTMFVGRDGPGAVWRSWYCVGYGVAWKLRGRETSGQWHSKSFMMMCTQTIVQAQLYCTHRYRNSEDTDVGLITWNLMFSSVIFSTFLYSCLKICKIPCLFPILSCRLQLQLIVKPAALLFRLSPWDEGKNCEMLWFMQLIKVNSVKPIK